MASTGLHAYLCECSRTSCREVAYLSLREYNRIRASSAYLVVPGHERDGEVIVFRGTGYLAVAEPYGRRLALGFAT